MATGLQTGCRLTGSRMVGAIPEPAAFSRRDLLGLAWLGRASFPMAADLQPPEYFCSVDNAAPAPRGLQRLGYHPM